LAVEKDDFIISAYAAHNN